MLTMFFGRKLPEATSTRASIIAAPPLPRRPPTVLLLIPLLPTVMSAFDAAATGIRPIGSATKRSE